MKDTQDCTYPQETLCLHDCKQECQKRSGWRKVQIDDAEEEAWKEMEKASAMREVQRLGQEIEQKPVAWGVFDTQNLHDMFFTKGEAQDMARLKGDGSIVKPLYTHLPKENT